LEEKKKTSNSTLWTRDDNAKKGCRVQPDSPRSKAL